MSFSVVVRKAFLGLLTQMNLPEALTTVNGLRWDDLSLLETPSFGAVMRNGNQEQNGCTLLFGYVAGLLVPRPVFATQLSSICRDSAVAVPGRGR